jgi:hypothetical protein
MFRNMVINLSKDTHFAICVHMMSTNSIQTNFEEDTFHQMMEDMDLGNRNSLPSNIWQKEATPCLSLISMFNTTIRILGSFLKLYICKYICKKLWDVLIVDFYKLCFVGYEICHCYLKTQDSCFCTSKFLL